jgi:hypothetical protein
MNQEEMFPNEHLLIFLNSFVYGFILLILGLCVDLIGIFWVRMLRLEGCRDRII